MTLADYGLLANCYVERFEQKWVRGTRLIPNSLAPATFSRSPIWETVTSPLRRCDCPFDLQDIGRLAAVTAVPILPLGLTVFSLEELVMRIVKILF